MRGTNGTGPAAVHVTRSGHHPAPGAPPEHAPSLRGRVPLRGGTVRRFARNRAAVGGLLVASAVALASALAPILAPANPLRMNLETTYVPPQPAHPFGTDDLGRDVLSRVLFGGRYDLGLAVVTVVIASGAGALAGAITGYSGGLMDLLLMRGADVLLAFPAFLLGLALVAFLGPSLVNIVLVLAIAHFPRYVRLVRGVVLVIRSREYVEAARAIGVPWMTVLVRHIARNAISPIIVYSTLDLGTVITSLAGLGFLGVGIQPPTPDWGLMLTTARNNLAAAPWTAFFPGLAIALTVIATNLMGDGLRDALDPRLTS